MKKYFILLSGLYFSQIQPMALIELSSSIESDDSDSETIKKSTAPSLVHLAFNEYRTQFYKVRSSQKK